MKAGLGIATIVLAIALVTVAGYIIYTLRKDIKDSSAKKRGRKK